MTSRAGVPVATVATVAGGVLGLVVGSCVFIVFLMEQCRLGEGGGTVSAYASPQGRWCGDPQDLHTTWPVYGFAVALLLGAGGCWLLWRRAAGWAPRLFALLLPSVAVVLAAVVQALPADTCSAEVEAHEPAWRCSTDGDA